MYKNHFLRVIPLVRKRPLASWTLIADLGKAQEELTLPIIGSGIAALGVDVGSAGLCAAITKLAILRSPQQKDHKEGKEEVGPEHLVS